jgi:hypothetical protein
VDNTPTSVTRESSFISSCKCRNLLKCQGLLKLNDAQQIPEARCEDGDLLWLLHATKTSEQGEELSLVANDRSGTTEMAQLTEQIVARRRAKPLIDKFAELQPRRVALVAILAVAFEAVIPLLGNTFHVEGYQPHLFCLGSAGGAKELVATVKPGLGIPGSIIL